MSKMPGRYCEMHGEPEVDDLKYGMDFREPRYRRAVFLRFYEYHLKYASHPGCVYYLFPYLAQVNGWGAEEKLWFAYINGNTQNPVTSWLIFREFPDVLKLNEFRLADWFNENYERLAFDTDRRYQKKTFLACVTNYRALLSGRSQQEFFAGLTAPDPFVGFRSLWRYCHAHYINFGRLSVFSYLEYLRVMGLDIDCDQLFLEDMSGSKSHRNGLAKVLGRDDLDWHSSNPSFDGRYPSALLAWLKQEGAGLLADAKGRLSAQPFKRDVSYFTLESTLCTYKGWHRPNRRYPNVYNDMLVERIRKAEVAWDQPMSLFWEARRAHLPEALRIEDNPADPGLKPVKQNHYLTTGQPVMMDLDWPCFKNDFNDGVRRQQEKAA